MNVDFTLNCRAGVYSPPISVTSSLAPGYRVLHANFVANIWNRQCDWTLSSTVPVTIHSDAYQYVKLGSTFPVIHGSCTAVIYLRDRVAAFRGPTPKLKCPREVLWRPLAGVMHGRKIRLALGRSLVSRLREQLDRPSIILIHPVAVPIHLSEVVLCDDITLLCRPLPPRGGLPKVLRHSPTVIQRGPEMRLRTCVALLGGLCLPAKSLQ
jgi:hypothetical protein